MASLRRAPRRHPSRLIALATVAAALAAAPVAHAGDYYEWAGGNHTNWSERNWTEVGGSGLTNADFGYSTYLTFGYSTGSRYIANNDVGTTGVQLLGFSSENWQIGGSQLNFDEDGSISVSSQGSSGGGINVKITNDIHLVTDFGYDQTQFPLTIDAGSTLTLTGHFDNDGSIYKKGGGTLVLNDFHNYTGGTNIDEGRIVDYSPQGNYRDSSELEFHSDANQTAMGTIFGSGKLFKSGAGTLTLTGAVSYIGDTSVLGGRLVMGVPLSKVVTVGSGATLEVKTAGNVTYSGKITDDGSFAKSGTGTITLSNANDYTGGTVVTSGRLVDLHPHGDYQNSATLDFNVTGDQTDSGVISGSGSFEKLGTGTLTLSGINTYTGSTSVNAGRLIDQHPHGNYYDSTVLELQTATDGTLAGGIFGGGSLVKSGAGTLTLSAGYDPNNPLYAGGTTVSGGRLVEKSPHGNYVDNAELEFANAAYAILQTPVAVGPPTPNYVSGTGNLTKSGPGELVMFLPNAYAGSTTVNGGTLTAAGSNNVLPTGTALTVNAGGTYLVGGGTQQTVASLSGAGSVLLGQSTAFTVSGAASTTFSGVISGYSGLTKGGTGTLTLSGKNTYPGITTVSAGILATGVDDALPSTTALVLNGGGFSLNDNRAQTIASLAGTGSLTLGNGSLLSLTGAASTTFSGIASGAGAIIKSGTGTLTLSGKNTSTGGVNVQGGTLRNGVANALSTSVPLYLYLGGTYDLNGYAQTLPTLYGDGTITLGSGGALTVNPASGVLTTFIGSITGAGSLTKSGAGTLTLSRSNLYGGTTTVSGGTLAIGTDGALPASTALTVNAGATLDLADRAQTVGSLAGDGSVRVGSGAFAAGDASSTTFSGVVSGTGTLAKNGTGTLTLSGVNTYVGGTTVNGGRLVDANPHGSYATNAELEFAKAGDYTYAPAITGTGSFLKDGVGTLTLSGVNTYANGTTILAGTLIDLNPHGKYDNKATLEFAPANDLSYAGNNVQGFGTFVKAGSGTLTLTSAIGSGIAVQLVGGTLKGAASSFRSDVSSTGGTLQFDGTPSASYNGIYSGSGALLKTGSGAVTLRNVPANTGGIRVSGGTLEVDGRGTMGGGLAVDSGATFLNRSGGTLAVGGRTVVQGAVDSYRGTTTDFTGLVSGAGNFVDTGTVRFDGGYSPGNSPASVSFAGGLVLGASNDLTMELGGTTPGTGYDHLTVAGLATLGGRLDIAYYNGFTASAGQSFDLFDFASSSGTFASLTLPTLGRGLTWNTSALYTTGTIRVAQAVPEPAALLPLGLAALTLLRRRRRI